MILSSLLYILTSIDYIYQFRFFFQPSYSKKKPKGGADGDGGRPPNWSQVQSANKKKVHYLIVVWGQGYVFGPYFYPTKPTGSPIMNGETHLEYVG